MRGSVAALGLALVLAGCTGLRQSTEEPVARAPDVRAETLDVRATLHFIEWLNEAEPDVLAAVGAQIGADRGIQARARRALWQATPGHSGYAPARAAQGLESLLDGQPELGETGKLLLQVQLQHLQERRRLVRSRAELMARNRELQRKIEELTALERRMGGNDGNDQ